MALQWEIRPGWVVTFTPSIQSHPRCLWMDYEPQGLVEKAGDRLGLTVSEDGGTLTGLKSLSKATHSAPAARPARSATSTKHAEDVLRRSDDG